MDDLLSIAVSNAAAATVLAAAAIAVGAVCRRPALVHGLWLLVLLKLVTPPLVFIPVAWPNAPESPAEVAVVQEEPAIAALPDAEEGAARAAVVPVGEDGASGVEVLSSVEELSRPTSAASPETPLWPQMLRIVWGVGALAWFVLVLERLHHFRRLLRFARPAPAALQERTRRLAQSLGLKYCPRVRLLPGRIAPMLWAIGGPPRLLVPVELLGVLSDEQLDTLLVHELAHLRRRDHWVRVLEFVVMGLYWWHPVVWYARRELREAEEQCCDAWVVSTLPNTGRTYASALLDTLDFLSTVQAAVPPLPSGLGHIADLKRRLTMIMQGNTPRSLTWPGCLAVITLGLTCLPMLPSLHGEPPTKEEAREQIQEAEKALEKAKEALERQKAELAKKLKELDKAEKQLAKESAREGLLRLKEHAEHVIEDGKDATGRIVITITADAKVRANELNDIIEKVQRALKVLPEKRRDNLELRLGPASGTHIWERNEAAPPAPMPKPAPSASAPPAPMPKPAPSASAPPGLQPWAPLLPGVPYPPGTVAPSNPNVPLSKSSEKRINDLEKKLEKVLRELHELQKQMKESRSGHSATPLRSLDPRRNPTLANPYYAPTVPLTPPEEKP